MWDEPVTQEFQAASNSLKTSKEDLLSVGMAVLEAASRPTARQGSLSPGTWMKHLSLLPTDRALPKPNSLGICKGC